MANTHILTSIPTVSTTSASQGDANIAISPDRMAAIYMRVEELKYVFNHDMEMSDKDCEDLAFINYCERMQVFEPFEIKQFDVIDALKKYDIIQQDRPELANYTKEESVALKNILLSKWNEIDFDMKVIFHALNGTLPCWSYIYPAPKKFIENGKDWINKKPILVSRKTIIPKFLT